MATSGKVSLKVEKVTVGVGQWKTIIVESSPSRPLFVHVPVTDIKAGEKTDSIALDVFTTALKSFHGAVSASVAPASGSGMDDSEPAVELDEDVETAKSPKKAKSAVDDLLDDDDDEKPAPKKVAKKASTKDDLDLDDDDEDEKPVAKKSAKKVKDDDDFSDEDDEDEKPVTKKAAKSGKDDKTKKSGKKAKDEDDEDFDNNDLLDFDDDDI